MPTRKSSELTYKAPLNLDLLRLFVLSAERGTITAAAREMKLSSSLATRKLAQLEMLLGVRLFQRTTRRMELTEGGSIALLWAQEVLASYAAVMDNLTVLSKRPSGTIKFAANHYGSEHYLPPVLAQFCRMYPEIRVSVSSTDSLTDLISGRYDVAVHAGRVPDSGLIGIRTAKFRYIICASPQYLERRGFPERPEELPTHDCLTHSTAETRKWFFRREGRLIAQPIQPLVETDNHSVLLKLVRNSLGIACLPEYMLRDDLANGRLLALLTDYDSVLVDGDEPALWVVYPNRRMFHRTRIFIDYLHKAIRASELQEPSQRRNS